MVDTRQHCGFAIIVETNPDGHRLAYVRTLVERLNGGPWMLVARRGILETPEYAHLAGVEPLQLIEVDSPTPSKALAAALLEVRQRPVHCVVVPDGDRYLWPVLRHRLRVRRATPISLLLMRTKPTSRGWRSTCAWLGKALLAFAISVTGSARVFFLTDAFGVVSRSKAFPLARPVNDPIRPHASAPADTLPREIQSRLNGFCVGICGVISRRKNPQILIDAAVADGRTTVVLAGKIDTELLAGLKANRNWLELERSGRLVCLDRMLSEAEFSSVLTHLSAVSVLYDNDAPSGILAEAVARGTPALAPAGGWLGGVVAKCSLGVVCPIESEFVAMALRELRENEPDLSRAALLLGTESFTDNLLSLGVV